MKTKVLIFLILLTALGCTKDHEKSRNACNCGNPLEEVAWLAAAKDSINNCTCELSIIQGRYNGRTVFFLATTDPLCDGIDMPSIFDCEGNLVKTFTSMDFEDFYKNVSRDKVLYRCNRNK